MSRPARALAALCLVAGCKERGAPAAPPPADPAPLAAPPGRAPAPPTAPPPAAAPPRIEALVAEARGHLGGNALELMELSTRYVRASGELDPTYGELEVGFLPPRPARPAPPPDDPKRPTGAPGGPPVREDDFSDLLGMTISGAGCPAGTWKGAWTWPAHGSCKPTRLSAPRCTVAELWQRAIARGAPKDALAVIELGESGTDLEWTFTIRDPARDLDVHLSLPDDCGVAVERGPVGEPPKPVDDLDDAAIADGVRAVRPALERCRTSGALAHVELALHVDRAGVVERAVVVAAPDTATGRCAAAALRTAHFPASRSGVSTTIPLEL